MDELIRQVKLMGGALASHVSEGEFDLRPVFRDLSVVPGTKKGKLLDVNESGQVVINSAHAMANKLADGKPGRAQVMVSAIISLVNRKEADLTDHHQRTLHRELLLSMVT